MQNAHNHALGAGNEEAQWISLSDLMTSLMMIFMLLAVIFMLKIGTDVNPKQQDAVSDATSYEPMKNEGVPPMPALTDVARNNGKKTPAARPSTGAMETAAAALRKDIEAKMAAKNAESLDQPGVQPLPVTRETTKKELYDELSRVFAADLQTWGAHIDQEKLIISFNDPGALFNTGDDSIRPKFQEYLNQFFPRYVAIITSEKYKNLIQEVRIEGHTSSKWNGSTNAQEAYYKNMELSQARTRSTLRYVLALPEVQNESEWLRNHLTANGLSSSRPVKNADGSENSQLSQRVEFRIRAHGDDQADPPLLNAER